MSHGMGMKSDRFSGEATTHERVRPHGLAPLDYVFRALVVLSAGEVGALAYNLATHPDTPGIVNQGLLPRVILGLIAGPSIILFSALLLWRAPRNVAGGFLLLIGMAEVGAQFVFDFGSPPVSVLMADLFLLFGAGIGAPSVGYLLLNFPTGKIYPLNWARRMKVVAVIKFLGVGLELMATPTRAGIFALPFNPLFVPMLAPFRLLIAVSIGVRGILLPLISLIGIISLVLRYRASETRVRQQIKWVVWAPGMGMLGAVVTLAFVFSGVATSLLLVALAFFTLAQATLLVSLTIAILRYHLFDIDRLINRTLVYGILTVAVIALYVVVVGAFGRLFETTGNFLISLLATGLIAILFQPMREYWQRRVNRLMYGERDEPYAALSRLGKRLEAALAPEAVLPTIAETVAQSLKLPYTAIELNGAGKRKLRTEYSSAPLPDLRPPALISIPLTYQNETVGRLLLAPRAPGESFGRADLRLLDDFARQAGIAAHAVRLTYDLQHTRERLVSAREEERLRIRRDLHDGLGPALASQMLKVGSARALFPQDSAAADQLLAELEHDIQAALADIRRLVYALRPPALDELGLASAIREIAAQYTAEGVPDRKLYICVDVPERLPPLPAAVEVAVFRIVQEALTNVVRHSQARACFVRLKLEDRLVVEISDDGRGLPAAPHAGIGLTSMRERAAELGGTCVIEARREGGTRVLVQLPLGSQE
jgi:signal transduction histidine kinase